MANSGVILIKPKPLKDEELKKKVVNKIEETINKMKKTCKDCKKMGDKVEGYVWLTKESGKIYRCYRKNDPAIEPAFTTPETPINACVFFEPKQKIKPCPACNNIIRVVKNRGKSFWVECSKDGCRLAGPLRYKEEEALDAWERLEFRSD